MLVRFPADGGSIMEPIAILVVGRGQNTRALPYTECSTEKDEPRYKQAK